MHEEKNFYHIRSFLLKTTCKNPKQIPILMVKCVLKLYIITNDEPKYYI